LKYFCPQQEKNFNGNLYTEYQNDLETPETAMLSIEEDENENENLTQTQPKWINPCGISKKVSFLSL